MKKAIKRILFASALTMAIGGTWVVSGAVHSERNIHQEISYAVASNHQDLPSLLLAPNHTNGTLINQAIGTAKAALSPIKRYVFGDDKTYFNGVEVSQVCFDGLNAINGGGNSSGGFFSALDWLNSR